MARKKKLRIIVRPWQPRNKAYPVTQAQLKAFIQTHTHLFEEILYIGWARRVEKGKKVVIFVVATGPTRLIAKQRFKESTDFENHVWHIKPVR